MEGNTGAIYCDKKVKVSQSFPTLCDPKDCSPWNSTGQNTGVISLSLLRGSSQLRDGTQVSHITGGFFTSWATREVQDTRVGSLSLLRRIFLSQVLNQGLLPCRWILDNLSYQGSPYYDKSCTLGGFPGSPVVKTWPSYAGGARLIPGCGTKIPHASWPKNQNIKWKQ